MAAPTCVQKKKPTKKTSVLVNATKNLSPSYFLQYPYSCILESLIHDVETLKQDCRKQQ